MAKIIKAIRGMNDILPDISDRWAFFEQTVQDWLAEYGYRNIRMPIVEHTDLFARSIGEVTDIVEKEMYTFVDQLNGESLTLRPEGTASCVRAAIEHNLLYGSPQRLYYSGPMFRHERPQKGRYRQFHQVGVEALGFSGPDIDAEHIIMCARLWEKLGLTDAVRLEIGTLGNAESRATHRAKLIQYFEKNMDMLDDDARRRLHLNPLRILDSKNPVLQVLITEAPKLIDDLDDESHAHFEALQNLLTQQGITFNINLQLVRGLDYYNRTVFEWITDKLGAQGTICGGGRYDSLIEKIGGRSAPACGFAMGTERLLILIEECGRSAEASRPDAYIVYQGETVVEFTWKIAEFLRRSGCNVILHCGGGSFKSQMKKADASGARFALIIGDDEVQAEEISVKSLRDQADQVRIRLDSVAELIHRST